jgi:hypothetical protein
MRGQTWAVNNFLNWIFIALAGGFYLGGRAALALGPTVVQAAAGVILLAYVVGNREAIATIAVRGDLRSPPAAV